VRQLIQPTGVNAYPEAQGKTDESLNGTAEALNGKT
jgi:hypothetical protein